MPSRRIRTFGLLAGLVCSSSAYAGDPARMQVFTAPTADTVGDDELRVANTMVGLTQFNYGVTDNVQLGIQNAVIAILAADVKYRFYRGEHAQAAVLVGGSTNTFYVYDGSSAYVRPVLSLRAGRAALHLGGGAAALARGSDRVRQVTGVFNGFAAGELALGSRVKLMTELNTVYDSRRLVREDRRTWGYGVYGARFFGARTAVDAGLLVPFDQDLLGAKWLGLPWFTLSYLFD